MRSLLIVHVNDLFIYYSQTLMPRRENTFQGFTDQMESSASELREKLEPLCTAAKYEAENVGHAVNQVTNCPFSL